MTELRRADIPKRVVVGGAVYEVRIKELPGCVGITEYRPRRITLDPSGLQCAAYAVNTLLHEVMHAIWYEWGIKDSDMDDFSFKKGYATEERAVNGLCNGLCAVFAANPKLFKLIAKYRPNLKGDA